MGDAPHGVLIFGVGDDDGGGGGGSCIGVMPMSWGNQSITGTTTTRYLDPTGDYSGNVAETTELGYTSQASGTLKRLQIRIQTSAGNGNDVVYTVNLNGAPTALTLVIPSTSAGLFSITADVVLVDGDVVTLEVSKALSIGASPMFIQAHVQVEDECGGGGGGGIACCSPTYIPFSLWNSGSLVQNLGDTTEGELFFSASACGQDETIVAAFRPADDETLTVPLVQSVTYSATPLSVLQVNYDSSGADDGNFTLHIINGCGCCTIIAARKDSV